MTRVPANSVPWLLVPAKRKMQESLPNYFTESDDFGFRRTLILANAR